MEYPPTTHLSCSRSTFLHRQKKPAFTFTVKLSHINPIIIRTLPMNAFIWSFKLQTMLGDVLLAMSISTKKASRESFSKNTQYNLF